MSARIIARFQIVFIITALVVVWQLPAKADDFFGGMMTGIESLAWQQHESWQAGTLLHVGGGGGARLGESPWLLGGRGFSSSLVGSDRQAIFHMRYGGVALIHTWTTTPLILGVELFAGGGSYSLFVKQHDCYQHHEESFFIVDPKLHLYYPVAGKLILDGHIGYLYRTTQKLASSRMVVGFNLIFGHL